MLDDITVALHFLLRIAVAGEGALMLGRLGVELLKVSVY